MKLFFFDCGTRDLTASIGLFFLRSCIASLMFFGHGLPKLLSFAEKKDQFPVPSFFPLSLMTSPVALTSTIVTEVLCAFCLILGFGSRFSAFLLGFTMVVAAFYIHANDPWFMSKDGASKEPALLYLVPCLALILSGPGRFSLDAMILQEKRRKRW